MGLGFIALSALLTLAALDPAAAASPDSARADTTGGSKRAAAPPAPGPHTATADSTRPTLRAPRPDVMVLMKKGRYADAAARASAVIDSLEAAGVPDSVELAVAMDGLAQAMWRDRKASDPAARATAERALGIKERALGPNHPELTETLMQLGLIVSDNGDYERARAIFERALVIEENGLGPDDPKVGWVLTSYGILLLNMGDYSGAKPLLERALAIREKEFGPDATSVAASLNPLGNLLQLMGDYTQARELYERSLKIREKWLGPDHVDVEKSLRTVASLDAAIGDYALARSRYERAIAIDEKILGPDHLTLARDLDALAGVLLAAGDTAAARPVLDRCRAIIAKNKSAGVPENLGLFQMITGDVAGARATWEQALAEREKAIGAESPETVPSRRKLGSLLMASGDLPGARAHIERARAIAQTALGPDHPVVAGCLMDLARLERLDHHLDAALTDALEAERIAREHVRITAGTLPERQALRYASVRTSGIDLAAALLEVDPSRERAQQVWDAVIRSRALVLDEMAARHRRVTEITRGSSELAAASERYANLSVRGAGDEPAERYRARLEEARLDRERAERTLAERSTEFQRMQARGQLGYAEVARNLPRGGVLIAFMRVRPDPKVSNVFLANVSGVSVPGELGDPGAGARGARYLAFVLKAQDRVPRAVPLGSAASIDSLVAAWGEAIKHPATGAGSGVVVKRYRKTAASLRERVWDPLAIHLVGAERVFIVPDGPLNLVSFVSLPVGDSSYVIESGPVFHYLSAERDLVPESGTSSRGNGLLMVASPDFDALGGTPSTSKGSRTRGTRAASTSSDPATRGARPSCADFRSLTFTPLPGAKREAGAIQALWRSAHDAGRARGDRGAAQDSSVLALSGVAATKSALEKNASGRSVLHIATHGFFLDARCPSALDASLVADEKGSPAGRGHAEGENPLLLSGLALSGANHRDRAASGADDGIVTADEIATLDLAGLRWAVLSACETGVGEIRAGEGVFGLRRAFEVAGARTLIMSLWPVDDAATEEWMRGLYGANLVDRRNTAESVRQSSLAMLQTRRAKGESTHPFYWAAFVASGDWH